jgi:hypothetical protein
VEAGLHLSRRERRQTTVDAEAPERPPRSAGSPSQPRHLRGDAFDRSPHQMGPLGPEDKPVAPRA